MFGHAHHAQKGPLKVNTRRKTNRDLYIMAEKVFTCNKTLEIVRFFAQMNYKFSHMSQKTFFSQSIQCECKNC